MRADFNFYPNQWALPLMVAISRTVWIIDVLCFTITIWFGPDE